jgi:hypothetical protein
MKASRYAVVFVVLVLLTATYTQVGAEPRPDVPVAAPLLQATPAVPDATPGTTTALPPAAPIGEGTRQVLTILGLAIGIIALIGGGIYLRHRWMATRY